MGTIIGQQCVLMHNSGTYASPTWAACPSVKDLTFSESVNDVDASRRGSGGYRQHEPTLSEIEMNVSFVKDKDDATFVAIESAAQAKSKLELAILDGPNAVGTDWLTAKWFASEWSEPQELEGVLIIDAVFKIAPDDDLNPTRGTGALPTSRP